MRTKKQGKPPIYANSLKIAVAREYLTGNSGYGALAAKHGIERRTVIHFVRWYKKHYPDGQPVQSQSPADPFSPSEQELPGQLKEANLKIAALEMLIETARKELGIDIIKKPGTKQS